MSAANKWSLTSLISLLSSMLLSKISPGTLSKSLNKYSIKASSWVYILISVSKPNISKAGILPHNFINGV